MAKIAVEFEPTPGSCSNNEPGRLVRRVLASGEGWSVADVLCTAGPHDRPFEEWHACACVAIVIAGSFQYQSSAGRELMTPGSLFLGNATQHFECSHEHGTSDRCISFSYQAPYFEALVAEAAVRSRGPRFQRLRVPPARELSALIARAVALAANGTKRPCGEHRPANSDWEGIGVELATGALSLANRSPLNQESSPAAEARVTRIVRMIEAHPEAEHSLSALAQEARVSRYHFLRVFQQLTGLTPHQYVRRARLRRAATGLILDRARVLDIALDSGFGDISNFNHVFREEFGVSPVSFRHKQNLSCRNSPPDAPITRKK